MPARQKLEVRVWMSYKVIPLGLRLASCSVVCIAIHFNCFIFNFAEIRIAPQSQHLLLNFDHTATFFCQAVGNDAYWSINGRTVPSEGNSSLREQGWTFNETLVEDPGVRHNIHNMTLRIPSKIEFNNTRILCIGVIHDPEYSVPAFLIIKGI